MQRMHLTPLFLLLILLLPSIHATVEVSIDITVQHVALQNNPKVDAPNNWALMYVGNYATTNIKVSAMKFALQYVNLQNSTLPNIFLDLYGYNSKGDKASTISAVFAGYAGYNIMGFIGAESIDDTITLQYIAGAYFVPQINPTTVEAQVADPSTYRSLINVIPSSNDQKAIVLELLLQYGIKSALVVMTDNDYGLEFNDLNFSDAAISQNITFYNVIIETGSTTDLNNKVQIIKTQMEFYRYVIMHCTSTTGLSIVQALYNEGLVGPDYLYIVTHSMVIEVLEDSTSANYLQYLNGAIGISARYNSDTPFAKQMRQAWAQANASEYAFAGQDLKSAWFAFDAVYSYALGLDQLIREGNTIHTIAGEEYYNSTLALEFDGATGPITFNTSTGTRNGVWDLGSFVLASNNSVGYVYRGIANVTAPEIISQTSNFTFFNGNTTLPSPYRPPVTPPKIRNFIKGLSIGLGAVVGLAIIVGIFSLVMLFTHWPSFSRHGSFYSAVIIIGVLISYVSALTILPEPTDGLCLAFPWFLGIGFSLVYGCLFIKTWTLYRIYLNAENFKRSNLSTYTILKAIGVNVLIEAIILIIWSVIDPPKAEYQHMVDGYQMLQCKTKHPTFWAIFVGTKGLWLIFGAVLSVLTRRIAKEYNHSSSIAYAIYNIFALLLVGIPLAITLGDIPGGRLIIEVAVIIIAFTFTVFSLFFPVWYRIFVPETVVGGVTISSSSGSASGTRTGSGATNRSSGGRSSGGGKTSGGRSSGESISATAM